MNTQRHAQIEADLKAFLDNELPFFRRQVVGRHIKNCPQCQQEIEFMQTIERELETATNAPLESELRSQILESAPASAPTLQPTPVTKTVRKVNKWEAGVALAGLAVMCVIFYPVFGGRARENARKSTSYLEQRKRINVEAGSPPTSSMADRADTTQKLLNDGDGTLNNGIVPQERAVHREGSLTVVVDNADAASSAVESIVKNTSGFVANNALSTAPDGKRAATLDLRIPVADFESVVEKVSKLGKVSAKSINGEDITARVAKAGATKDTLSKELAIREAQLRQKEKSVKAGDANALYYLRIEVRNLRVQASQARAQLETLQKYAALANLFVTLQDKEKPVAPVGWTNDINQTGQSAWSSFLGAAKLPIQLLIWVLAYSPLWIPALIIWKKFGRKWLES